MGGIGKEKRGTFLVRSAFADGPHGFLVTGSITISEKKHNKGE